jgi:hypothetical protein
MGLCFRLVGWLVSFTSRAQPLHAFQVHALLVWAGLDIRAGHILGSTGPTRLPCRSGGLHFVLNWTTICHWQPTKQRYAIFSKTKANMKKARDRQTHARCDDRKMAKAQLLLNYFCISLDRHLLDISECIINYSELVDILTRCCGRINQNFKRKLHIIPIIICIRFT